MILSGKEIKKHMGREIIIPEEGLVLEPNKLYLGRTKEYTRTDNYVLCWKDVPPRAGWACLSM